MKLKVVWVTGEVTVHDVDANGNSVEHVSKNLLDYVPWVDAPKNANGEVMSRASVEEMVDYEPA